MLVGREGILDEEPAAGGEVGGLGWGEAVAEVLRGAEAHALCLHRQRLRGLRFKV